MGDRYILTIECPKCRCPDNNVYFAPTCGFTDWSCPDCSHEVDLCEYTGISYEDASNVDAIKQIVDSFVD